MKKILFTVIALMLSNTLMFGQEKEQIVSFDTKEDILAVGKSIYFLKDEEGKMSIADVLNLENQKKFIRNENDIFNRDPTYATYWFKITVQNETSENIWMALGSSHILYLDFYSPDSLGKYTQIRKTGAMRPDENKFQDVINGFWLPLNKAGDKQLKTYYIRITQELPIIIPFYVGSLEKLYQNKNTKDYISAGFVGLVMIMFLYNIFLFFSTRDQIYLWYVGYLFWALITATFVNNYPFVKEIDFPYLDNEFLYKYFFVWHTPMYIFVGVFCIKYLNLSNHKANFSRILIYIEILTMSGIYPLLNLLGFTSVDLSSSFLILLLMLYFTCLTTGYYLVYKGDKNAYFYVLGWTFMLFFNLIFTIDIGGIIPPNIFSNNSLYFGISLEIWMFSLALGDRLNVLRKENERMLREQNATLEDAVIERTEELQVMNEELNSTVEELSITLELLEEQKRTIEVINNKITTSIDYAQTIQGVILADDQYLSDCLSDYFLIYRPKDIVSGDFYWLHPLKNGLMVVVADCTGHGVAGSFMSLIGINLLDNMEKEMEVLSPAEIISKLNIAVEKALKQGERNSYNEGMDIAVCKINHARGGEIDVEFSGAKRPLYYTSHGNHSLMSIEGDRKSVGSGINPPYEFQNHRIKLAKGDMVYLCSDGFEDQNNPERKKFGEKRLKNILGEISRKNVQEQREILILQLEAHQLSAEQRDDITLMGIRL